MLYKQAILGSNKRHVSDVIPDKIKKNTPEYFHKANSSSKKNTTILYTYITMKKVAVSGAPN